MEATLPQVKKWLEIKTASTDDDLLLTDMLADVKAAFQAELARDMVETTYTLETYNGTGQPRLSLRQFPVTLVSFLKIDEIVIDLAPNSQSAGFLFDDNSVYLTGLISQPGVPAQPQINLTPIGIFTRGAQNVLVTYTAGFPSGDRVLKQLTRAQIQQVAYEYRGRKHIGESNKTLGAGQTTTYQTDAFLPGVQRTLDRLKKVAPIR